jgi:predicted ATP-dependent protease
MQILQASDLNATINLDAFTFNTTAELVDVASTGAHGHGWVAQSEAQKAALFGLNIRQTGFHVLVLGAQGSGRSSLMHSAMIDVSRLAISQPLQDLVAIEHIEQAGLPRLLKLPVGMGADLRSKMDIFSRDLMLALPQLAIEKSAENNKSHVQDWLKNALQPMQNCVQTLAENTQKTILNQYLSHIEREVLAYILACQITEIADADNSVDSLINEAFFARLRVNVLVDNRETQAQALLTPVVVDNDPSLKSLFGHVESASDNSATPDFLRLRAGNLHKADGGMLQLHLRDLISDEQNGAQIIEKLHRFLRNNSLQVEDASSAQSSGYMPNTLLNLNVKMVLIATREDFYACLDEQPDFFNYFPVKVEFAERIAATPANYAAIAAYVAQKCVQHQCAHFTKAAVAALIGALQRLEEDQTRISTHLAFLEYLMLESAAFANGCAVVDAQHVQAAIAEKSARNRYFEMQILDSIIDNELLIQVQGDVVGQVNGLTHIELGDASFGSPIRITARCYPGGKGLINIDREVNMSGPNHDKGIFILQNWLSASFSHLAPLSLNASLVFEQEYNGVEGDSASCAELFALLSALARLPINQGIAVTGALNQFGEVMPIGGVNEKIEGYFRVCQALGLTGKQGVIIPKRNQRHLLLNTAVVQAVAAKQFHIITIDHVLEGIAYLTGVAAGDMDMQQQYPTQTVMGHVQTALAGYRKTLESNQPQKM